jgi:uncharacterized protein YndB with AHSA1/START domain
MGRMNGLTVDRHLAAPPERVWRAVTDPAELATWFWPPRFETVAELEAREGGALRIVSEQIGMGVTGSVTAVEPGRVLVTTWRWDGEDLVTHVTIALTPDGDGTRITVRHDGFADGEAAAEHVRGWNDCLDRLPAALADAG